MTVLRHSRLLVSPRKQVAITLALCAVFSIVYWPSIASMIDLWSSSAHRHAKLVPFLAVFLLWRGRHTLSGAEWKGSLWGLSLLGLFVWIWTVARTAGVQLVEHAALVAILNAFILSVAGFGAYRKLAFPLLLLVFCVPAGEVLVPHLMKITADIASAGLAILGIPAYREGVFLTLPNGAFEVAEVCSGIRYLNAGLLIGVLIAQVSYTSLVRKLIFVSGLVLLFVGVNGVRATLVMAIANATDMTLMVGFDHILFGWALFLMATIAMYAVAIRTSDLPAEL